MKKILKALLSFKEEYISPEEFRERKNSYLAKKKELEQEILNARNDNNHYRMETAVNRLSKLEEEYKKLQERTWKIKSKGQQ